MVVRVQTLKGGKQGFVETGVVPVDSHDRWGVSRAVEVVFVGTLLLLHKGAEEAPDGGVGRLW